MLIRMTFSVESGQQTHYAHWGKKIAIEMSLQAWQAP